MFRYAFRDNRKKYLLAFGIFYLALLYAPFSALAQTYDSLGWETNTNSATSDFGESTFTQQQEAGMTDFSPVSSGWLCQVTLDVFKVGSPTDQVLLTLYGPENTPRQNPSPGGTLVATTTATAGTSQTVFNFGACSFVEGGKYYQFHLTRTGAQSDVNFYRRYVQSVGASTQRASVFTAGSWTYISPNYFKDEIKLEGWIYNRNTPIVIPTSTLNLPSGLDNVLPFCYLKDFQDIIAASLTTSTQQFPTLNLWFGPLVGTSTVFSSNTITYYVGASNISLFRSLMGFSLWIIFAYGIYHHIRNLPKKT